MSARKPRSDAKLLTLPEEFQRELFKSMRNGTGHAQAMRSIWEAHRVKTSGPALTAFYQTWSRRSAEERIIRAVTDSEAIISSTAGALPKIDQAMEAALKQAAFEASLSGDNEAIKTLVTLVLKFKAADQDDRKIALQERRLRQAEEAEAVAKDEKLSPEQQQDRLRQIFGIK